MTSPAVTVSAVRLRPMRWWDIEPVLRLEAALFTDDAWSDAMFWSELAEPDTRHYVVAVTGDDTVVGYAGLCVYGPEQAYVQTIAVAADHHRAGIGTLLLTHVLAEAGRRGSTVLDLEVRVDNAAAIALYERHGFRPVGVRRGYYQPSGADALVMRRSGQ